MNEHATDRQIVERLLIPSLFRLVFLAMKSLAEADEKGSGAIFDPALVLLNAAMEEQVRTLRLDRADKLVRRVRRATTKAVQPIFHHQLGTQYLIVAFWTKDLVERGLISVGADSAFGQAWDTMAELMTDAWDDLGQLETMARREAQALRLCIEGEGHFV